MIGGPLKHRADPHMAADRNQEDPSPPQCIPDTLVFESGFLRGMPAISPFARPPSAEVHSNRYYLMFNDTICLNKEFEASKESVRSPIL